MDTPQPTPSPEAKPEPIQLLPLKEGGENEKLANMLALLMASEGADPAEAANSALFILTGIQVFLDCGSVRPVERLWRPSLVCRQLEIQHGKDAWIKASEMAGKFFADGNELEGQIYQQAAVMLCPDETLLKAAVDDKQ